MSNESDTRLRYGSDTFLCHTIYTPATPLFSWRVSLLSHFIFDQSHTRQYYKWPPLSSPSLYYSSFYFTGTRNSYFIYIFPVFYFNPILNSNPVPIWLKIYFWFYYNNIILRFHFIPLFIISNCSIYYFLHLLRSISFYIWFLIYCSICLHICFLPVYCLCFPSFHLVTSVVPFHSFRLTRPPSSSFIFLSHLLEVLLSFSYPSISLSFYVCFTSPPFLFTLSSSLDITNCIIC